MWMIARRVVRVFATWPRLLCALVGSDGQRKSCCMWIGCDVTDRLPASG